MTLAILRDDALRSHPAGVEILLSLPWIRSLPITSLRGVAVRIDGEETESAVAAGSDWWRIQDRVAVLVRERLDPGPHDVAVSFDLVIPYLAAGPDGPLVLPFVESRQLILDASPAPRPGPPETTTRTSAPSLADPTWTLAASAFNWTPDVIAATRSARDIAVGIVADGVSDTIEIEAGQTWRSFPTPTDSEVDALRARLDAAGGRVSIVGASIDDWTPEGRRRTDQERFDFLLPQLRTADRVGAVGVRVPLGQAGPELLRLLQPVLHDLDIVLFEEAQGHQTPTASARAYDDIADLDDPHVRLLIDISMLMPALPITYLERLRAGGLDAGLMYALEGDWRHPTTRDLVVDALRSGAVPGPLHTLFMNLLVRFGRSDAADLRGILPLVSAVHLKFWDLADADGRVSGPLRDIGAELRAAGFAGTLCSEWGGHEWLDDDPADMTRAHLALARDSLNPCIDE